MHEVGFAVEIARVAEEELLAQRGPAARLVRVHVRIGSLRQVDSESLAFAWEAVTRDTLCAGAVLEVDTEAALLTCRNCRESHPVHAPPFTCDHCGGYDVEVTGGMDLCLERLEVTCDG